MEVPTVIGLGLGFDGTSNWINKNVVDKYILGVDDFRPEEYSVGRKFAVLWAFLTFFTYLLYFTLCPVMYHFLFRKRDENGENIAAWNYREGRTRWRTRSSSARGPSASWPP